MISPHTPPGTQIVCVDVSSNGKYLNAFWVGGLDGLKQGQIYTVKAVYPTHRATSGFAVLLCEIEREGGQGWAIDRFRYLDLPASITDALKARPVTDKVHDLVD